MRSVLTSVEKPEGTEFLIIKSNAKQFCSPSKEKYFHSLIILTLFFKSCVNPFVDTTLTFFSRSSSLVSNFSIPNLSTLLFKLLKPLGTFFNLSMSILSTLLFKLLKPRGTFFNLSMSNLSTLLFKLLKTPFAFLNLFLLHNYTNLTQL